MKGVAVMSYNEVVAEYKDILPSYTAYVDAKRKYQLGELDDKIVLTHLENLCHEISEFLDLLYSDTDMWKERKIINTTIIEMKEHCK